MPCATAHRLQIPELLLAVVMVDEWTAAGACSVPFLPQHGNHEIEAQYLGVDVAGLDNGLQFQSYVARNPTPHTQSGSDNPLWYSVNMGPAHMIYLTSYDNFAVGSDQYDWLLNDLAT